jgi:hypothetical protein
MISEFLDTLLIILTALYALYLLFNRLFGAYLLSTRIVSLYQLQAVLYLFNGYSSHNTIAILTLLSYAIVGEVAIMLTPQRLRNIKDLKELFGANLDNESKFVTINKILIILSTSAFCIVAFRSNLFIYTIGNEYLAEITSQLGSIDKIIIKTYQAVLPGLFLAVFINKSNESRKRLWLIIINILYVGSFLVFSAYSLLNSRIALTFLLIIGIILGWQLNYRSKKLLSSLFVGLFFLSVATSYRSFNTDLGKSIDFLGRIDCSSAYSLSSEYIERNPPILFTAYRYDTIGIEAALFGSEDARSLIKSGEAGSKGYILRNVLFTKYYDNIWCAPIPHFLSFGHLSILISPILAYILIFLILSGSRIFQSNVVFLILLVPILKFELDPISALISILPICLFLVFCVQAFVHLHKFLRLPN